MQCVLFLPLWGLGLGLPAEERLLALARQDPGGLLGWLSYRPGTPLSSCSMREAAVTQALLRLLPKLRQQQQQQQDQPDGAPPDTRLLLLLISTHYDHNGGTLTWQYRCGRTAGAGGGDWLWWHAGGWSALSPLQGLQWRCSTTHTPHRAPGRG